LSPGVSLIKTQGQVKKKITGQPVVFSDKKAAEYLNSCQLYKGPGRAAGYRGAFFNVRVALLSVQIATGLTVYRGA
jgi:hypothetical protein